MDFLNNSANGHFHRRYINLTRGINLEAEINRRSFQQHYRVERESSGRLETQQSTKP